MGCALVTIRPGSYPYRRAPAHVHLTLDSPRFGRQWTPELQFGDDPLVSAEARARSAAAGRFGPVRPVEPQPGGEGVRVQLSVRLKPRSDF